MHKRTRSYVSSSSFNLFLCLSTFMTYIVVSFDTTLSWKLTMDSVNETCIFAYTAVSLLSSSIPLGNLFHFDGLILGGV